MAVSTVSVIESIIVMRLCSMQQNTKIPSVVHSIAFRVIGRALCVGLSSNKHRARKQDRKTEPEQKATSDVQESLLGDTELSNVGKSGPELVEKINDVLVELRKVRPDSPLFDALQLILFG